ncbi:hypothetical protein AB0M29_23995 [Streptomyces sp. NPDC051976]|uniref:hypothetical protein n=1 Tax=Streptomyces sp. NPDC051976 TaxID=3154947 RepID=UPI003439072E
MPSYDSARARFRLADRHISVLGHLMDGESPPAEFVPSLGELQQLGLVGQEGELSPLLSDLLTTLADPMVMIQVEVTGEHGPVTHGVVVGRRTVVAHDGWPGEEESEYLAIEPGTLVWELARKVNLRTAEAVDPPVRRIETTMGALDAALAGSPDADVASAAGGLAEPALSLFADLVAALNSTWRVTTVWDGAHDGAPAAHLRALAVWDCGPLGYWIRDLPEEPVLPGRLSPTTPLRLTRSTAAEIWERLGDLLPGEGDLVDESEGLLADGLGTASERRRGERGPQ